MITCRSKIKKTITLDNFVGRYIVLLIFIQLLRVEINIWTSCFVCKLILEKDVKSVLCQPNCFETTFDVRGTLSFVHATCFYHVGGFTL